jgi:hypothetical protein
MIRSQVPQRTTPWTAGIFHDADKKGPMLLVELARHAQRKTCARPAARPGRAGRRGSRRGPPALPCPAFLRLPDTQGRSPGPCARRNNAEGWVPLVWRNEPNVRLARPGVLPPTRRAKVLPTRPKKAFPVAMTLASDAVAPLRGRFLGCWGCDRDDRRLMAGGPRQDAQSTGNQTEAMRAGGGNHSFRSGTVAVQVIEGACGCSASQ